MTTAAWAGQRNPDGTPLILIGAAGSRASADHSSPSGAPVLLCVHVQASLPTSLFR